MPSGNLCHYLMILLEFIYDYPGGQNQDAPPAPVKPDHVLGLKHVGDFDFGVRARYIKSNQYSYHIYTISTHLLFRIELTIADIQYISSYLLGSPRMQSQFFTTIS